MNQLQPWLTHIIFPLYYHHTTVDGRNPAPVDRWCRISSTVPLTMMTMVISHDIPVYLLMFPVYPILFPFYFHSILSYFHHIPSYFHPIPPISIPSYVHLPLCLPSLDHHLTGRRWTAGTRPRWPSPSSRPRPAWECPTWTDAPRRGNRGRRDFGGRDLV